MIAETGKIEFPAAELQLALHGVVAIDIRSKQTLHGIQRSCFQAVDHIMLAPGTLISVRSHWGGASAYAFVEVLPETDTDNRLCSCCVAAGSLSFGLSIRSLLF